MKKIALAVSALSILLIGCTKEQSTVNSEENVPQVEEGKVFSFDATIEQADDPDATRASIDASSGTFSWANKDNIAVQLTDNTFKTFTYDSSKGKFLATLGDGESILDGGVAYYPATIAINGTPESVRFVAGIQSGNPSGFPMKAIVSLESHTLSFTHLGGFLRLTLSRIPKDAATLQFEASGVTLSGDFAVSNGKISAASGTKTTLSCSVSESATSKVYTLIVPETSFASGFSIKILNGSSEELYTKSTSNSISVGRAKIKPMAALTVPVSMYVHFENAWRPNNPSDNAYLHVWGQDVDGNKTTWPGWEINNASFSTVTHNGVSYKRIFDDVSLYTYNNTTNAIVHLNWNDDGANQYSWSSWYRVQLNSISSQSDIYLSVTPVTSSTVKVFIRNWTNNGYMNYIFSEDGILGTWPGKTIASLSTGDTRINQPYFTATKNSAFRIKGHYDGEYNETNEITVDAKCDYLITLKEKGKDPWLEQVGEAQISAD